MDQRWRTGRLSGTKREKEGGFQPLLSGPSGLSSTLDSVPGSYNKRSAGISVEETRRHNAFSRELDMCHDFIISGGKGREGVGWTYIYTWWWPPFVSLIVSATALFLSSLVTSATGFARSVKTRHIVRKAYGPRGSSYFSGTLSPFFSPRGSRIVNRPDSTAFLRSSFCFSSRYMYIYNAVVNRRRCNWRRDVIYITLSVIGSSPDFFLDRVYDIFLDDSYYNL